MSNNEVLILGAGCFWGVEAIIGKLDGVLKTSVGYIDGHTENPSYEEVCRGDTGHVEVVQVEFDPGTVSCEVILDYFWRLHDPTTLNRQGPDIGTQYRSAIFCESIEQLEKVQLSKKEFDQSGVFEAKSVTEIKLAPTFYPAEDYHQQYYDKKYLGGPGPICHRLRDK